MIFFTSIYTTATKTTTKTNHQTYTIINTHTNKWGNEKQTKLLLSEILKTTKLRKKI